MSVEKVLMSKDFDENTLGIKTFYERTDSNQESPVYFKDFGSNKYVIEDNSFVMLENNRVGNEFSSRNYPEGEESIMLSFGQYILPKDEQGNIDANGVITTATKTTTAQITGLNVERAEHNGNDIANQLRLRNIDADGNRYFDTMFVINQKTDSSNEGYYYFEFRYTVGGVTYSASFEFYVINQTSYTQSTDYTIDGKTESYSSSPELSFKSNESSLTKGEKNKNLDYRVGVDGIFAIKNGDLTTATAVSYPTLTYDYMRYKLNFSYTANRKVQNVDVEIRNNSYNSGKVLVMTSSSSSGEQVVEYNLDGFGVGKNGESLVSLIFTKKGSYQFDFKYIYVGYKPGSELPVMNLSGEEYSRKLTIHGFEANYSKVGYTGAELKYMILAGSPTGYKNGATVSAIDQIVVNGIERKTNRIGNKNLSDFKNQKIDLMFDFADQGNALSNGQRIGTEIIDKASEKTDAMTQDSLVNASLKTSYLNGTKDEYDNLVSDYDYLIGFDLDQSDISIDEKNEIEKVLNGIEYTRTNQGSVWFETNAGYDNSFYFYSPNKLTIKNNSDGTYSFSANKETYSNQTSFNRVGYYLVFVNVQISSTENFFQIFAFKYSTDAVNIKTTTNETPETLVGAGGFTTKDVVVEWAEPWVFEKSVSAKLYRSIDDFKNRADIVKSGNGTELQNKSTVVGVDDSFVQYVVELKSESESLSYKMFTIDRQKISGVKAFVVSNNSLTSGNFYSVAFDNEKNQAKTVDNGITDSLSTIWWQDKPSGAIVNVSYSYTPFVKSNSESPRLVNSDGSSFVFTNYVLGSTTGAITTSKAQNLNNIDSNFILSRQGIYIFTLTDEAGNSCQYMLIVDKTENFFELKETGSSESSFKSSGLTIFSKDFDYNVGDFKAINLNNENNSVLNGFINKLRTDNERELNYFDGTGSNIGYVKNMFRLVDGKICLTVQNHYVLKHSSAETGVIKLGTSGKINYLAGNATSYVCELGVFAGNNVYSSQVAENDIDSYLSKIKVEINQDNSRGYIYMSDNENLSQLPDGDLKSDNNNAVRVFTGNNINGVNNAIATKYVYFSWIMGSGDYQVDSVKYYHYSLNRTTKEMQTLSFDGNSFDIYFYDPNTKSEQTIYEKSTFKNGAKSFVGSTDNATRGLFRFGVGSTEDGLYIVERKYKEDAIIAGNDPKTRYYFFIVDNGEVIETGTGENISINLLEEETLFKDFSKLTTNRTTVGIQGSPYKDVYYTKYLQSNKVPATIKVPVGKYFANNLSSNYMAGRLRATLYFKDIYNQLDANKQNNIEIYSANTTANENCELMVENGFIKFDILSYLNELSNLTDLQKMFKERAFDNIQDKDWLTLAGEYVLVIEDNSLNMAGNRHYKIIGFEITKDVAPVVEIDNGFKDDHSDLIEMSQKIDYDKNGYVSEITTNSKYVRLVLPKYDKADTNASLDDHYLIVSQFYDGVEKPYINYQYKLGEGYDIVQESNSPDGNVIWDAEKKCHYIYLDTKLETDANGNYVNLDKSLFYTITIRYRLSKDGTDDKFDSAYYYWDSTTSKDENGNEIVDWKKKQTYETIYTIKIDRVAPSENANALAESETNFLAYYGYTAENNIIGEICKPGANNSLVFYRSYLKYHNQATKSISNLYPFIVNGSTEFKKDPDTTEIRVREFGLSGQLDIPISNKYAYTQITLDENITSYTFANVLGGVDKANKYYEILEYDNAGNVSQYLVYYYSDSVPSFEINGALNDTQKTFDSTSLFDESSFTEITGFSLNVGDNKLVHLKVDDVEYNFGLSGEDKNIEIKNQLEKVGNHTIEIAYRTVNTDGKIEIENQSYQINVYNKDISQSINLSSLVDSTYSYIDFDKAHVDIGETGNSVKLYLTRIVITENGTTTTYYCDTKDYQYYKLESGEKVYLKNNRLTCEQNSVYLLNGVDSVGRQLTTYRFSTIENKIFYEIFKRDYLTGNYKEFSSTIDEYYAFDNVQVKYDTNLYPNVTVKVIDNDGKTIGNFEIINGAYTGETKYFDISEDGTYTTITLKLQQKNIVKFDVVLDETTNEGFDNIIIDGRVEKVTLTTRANAGRDLTDFTFFNTRIEDITSFAGPYTQVHKLSWNNPSAEQQKKFNYVYILHEKQTSGGFIKREVNGSAIDSIYPSSKASSGCFVFEIQIRDKSTNNALGNICFAFEIRSELSALYVVRDGSNNPVLPNSNITKEQLNALSGLTNGDLPENIDLYINNIGLNIDNIKAMQSSSTDVKVEEVFTKSNLGTELKLFKISSGNYTDYIVFMNVEKTSDIVQNIKITVKDTSNNNETSYDIGRDDYRLVVPTNTANSKIEMSWNLSNYQTQNILNFNKLMLNIYYGDTEELVGTVYPKYSSDNTTITFTMELLGSGSFRYEFVDIAGNKQLFYGNRERLNIVPIQDVVLTINGQTPIKNAFYNLRNDNGEFVPVELRVLRYVTSNPTIEVYKNGQHVQTASGASYSFTEYGVYKVVVSALYSDGKNTYLISSTLNFTIINDQEVYPSLDFGCLANYTLNKVCTIKADGTETDVTEVIKKIVASSSSYGMGFEYESLMKHAQELDLVAGKIKFKLSYTVEDKIYPKRDFEFSFTLNNETPSIQCSLEPGESTKKEFSISFNPALLYLQIGEADIYINDQLVWHISENSTSQIQTISRSFKQDGKGDYYIKVINTSGKVLSSYKVEIKEPLNTWAIVVIIVVVGVVLAITITIIVLRNKMKIR